LARPAARSRLAAVVEKRSGASAFKAINDSIDPDTPTFSMVNAEMLLKMIWQAFLQDRATPDQLDYRARQIVIQNMLAFREDYGFSMRSRRSEVECGDTLPLTKCTLPNSVRAIFFIDTFPNNEKRFPITFADLQAEPRRTRSPYMIFG
jgi:hypothetical protein